MAPVTKSVRAADGRWGASKRLTNATLLRIEMKKCSDHSRAPESSLQIALSAVPHAAIQVRRRCPGCSPRRSDDRCITAVASLAIGKKACRRLRCSTTGSKRRILSGSCIHFGRERRARIRNRRTIFARDFLGKPVGEKSDSGHSGRMRLWSIRQMREMLVSVGMPALCSRAI